MSVVQPPEAIDWEYVISQADTRPELSGSAREKGAQLHQWLQMCFETVSVEFEQELEWDRGRFDCCDGHYIYEFKTVYSVPSNPRGKDVEQISRYLSGTGLRHGVVVYIEREGFDVRQFLVTVES